MTPCLAPAKTDVAPQHNSQSIDLIEFRQIPPDSCTAKMLRDNNSTPGNAQLDRGFPQTIFVAPDDRDGDRSTLTNPARS